MTVLYNHPIWAAILDNLVVYGIAGVILTGGSWKRASSARPDGKTKP